MNTTTDDEVAVYAAAVRAEFADLPEGERDELLEDLEDHLREVAAEDEGSLAERLGPPAVYAEELRAAAALPARSAGPAGSARERLARSGAVVQLGQSWRAVATSPTGVATLGFLAELRPAWWVLRGYLAVQFVAKLLGSLGSVSTGLNEMTLPFPTLLGSEAFGLVAVVLAVIASVALGRRAGSSRRLRGWVVAGNVVLVWWALSLFATYWGIPGNAVVYASGGSTYPEAAAVSHGGGLPGLRADGREITNIYPFDAQGRPLRDVYLVDQDGIPLTATQGDGYADPLGEPVTVETQYQIDRRGVEVVNLYPLRQTLVNLETGARRPIPVPGFQPGPIAGQVAPGATGPPVPAPSAEPEDPAAPTTQAPPPTRR